MINFEAMNPCVINKWFFLFVFFLVLSSKGMMGQTKLDRDFRFIYVAHDNQSLGSVTNVENLQLALLGIKNEIDNSAADDRPGNPSVFYLSNGSSYEDSKIESIHGEGDENKMDTVVTLRGTPMVIKMFMPDDNRNDFEEKFLREIQDNRAHYVFPYKDLSNILQILQEADFLDDNNQLKYNEVIFDFYVHPSFWQQDFHKQVIAALYFVLDADKYGIRFNIHHMISSGNPKPSYWDDKADFGPWNISNINNATKVRLRQ